jgi:hypothetical protein
LDTDPLAETMQTIQAFSAIISIRFSSLPDTDLGTLRAVTLLTIEPLAKDKSHFFSNPDTIGQIQAALKYLAPEIPFLAPVALNWALTMHRLFSSLTGEGEEIPKTHVPALVNSSMILF